MRQRLRHFKRMIVILAVLGLIVPALAQQRVSVSHALALHGDVKYGPDFKNFAYVNPSAPKGGTIRLATIGTFDSLNPFILKGVPAAGVGLLFDTLTVQSDDEPFTEYGLIAEKIEVPSDRSWVAYQLHPEAKWHDGSPITSDDVVFSFETLIAKGHPFYKAYYNDVLRVEKLGPRKVRFVFRQGSNPELALIMGQLPVFSKKYYTENPFDKTSLDPPMGSGPYRVAEVKPGRSVTFQRVPEYWAFDLAVNRGRYNFDTIRYEYYRDETVVVEAFKAGEYDFRLENVAKTWATAYEGSAFNRKLIIKEELPNENPTGMQAYVFNTRRSIFKDRRVRLALSYVFDFEWTNKTFFYGTYTRTKSYFSNSELASSGLPAPEELRLLEPFRKQLPPEVFTQEYDPPKTDGSGNIRDNLNTALGLLKQAGWELKGGKLVKLEPGKAPVAFEFEMLFEQPSDERIGTPFKKNLERIGITANIRTVDASQYEKRIENYDFDMTSTVWAQSLSPGNEQRDFWSSAAADRPGTRNLAGIKDPAVDALINRVITAPDRAGLVAACRALDRVLLWGYYGIPHWHIRTYRIAYWNKFGRPAVKPKYGLGYVDTWWIEREKEKTLEK
jgi:microcin C transport system substrate-binding protein